MKIILEGCDGTGKTTLAKILAERYKLDICHLTQRDPTSYYFYAQTARKEDVVWDRHTLGELIYPEIFDRKQNLSFDQARVIIDRAKSEGVKILILTAENDVIKQRLLERKSPPEDERIIANYEKINGGFVFYGDVFGIPVIDTTKVTLTEIFDMIEKE